jgi:Protein of unknown function (DUF3237)
MPELGDEGRRPGRLRRREVLKAVAAPVVAGATSALAGFARAAGGNDRSFVADRRETAMNSQPLMTVRIGAAPAHKLGTVPHGIRSIVPVVGGDFEGPRLRGKVLPGGGDWLLLRSDGVLELDLRITLETDDHALIYMTFQGLRHGPPDAIAALGRGEVVDPARYYFRTLPRFETSTDRYAFLNRIITVGVGEARPDGAVHRIDEIL